MKENWGKKRKVELLPTRDCEAGYAPAVDTLALIWELPNQRNSGTCPYALFLIAQFLHCLTTIPPWIVVAGAILTLVLFCMLESNVLTPYYLIPSPNLVGWMGFSKLHRVKVRMINYTVSYSLVECFM